jgi:hypothetical protein
VRATLRKLESSLQLHLETLAAPHFWTTMAAARPAHGSIAFKLAPPVFA